MTREQLTQEWRKQLQPGDLVGYQKYVFTVRRITGRLDADGCQMLEIASSLVISRRELNLPTRGESLIYERRRQL